MKNNFTLLSFGAVLCLLLSMVLLAHPVNVFAENVATDASSSSSASSISSTSPAPSAQSTIPTKINAKILPTVWYSTLSVGDGDSVQIFSVLQNNSGISFDGTVTFFVDDKEILSKSFSSADGSLKELSANWVAVPGDHNVKVSVSSLSIPTGKVLGSYESEVSKISITRKITAEVVQQAILNTANSVVSGADALAKSLSGSIESLKINGGQVAGTNTGSKQTSPAVVAGDSSSQNNLTTSADGVGGKIGSVLGTSTSNTVSNRKSKGGAKNGSGISAGGASSTSSADGIKGPLIYIYNMLVDLLALLVWQWKWTLAGIVVLILALNFMNKGGGRYR